MGKVKDWETESLLYWKVGWDSWKEDNKQDEIMLWESHQVYWEILNSKEKTGFYLLNSKPSVGGMWISFTPY